MNEKQEELKQQMEVLNRQMFLLNTEIYSIRCFMGETVDFIPLTTGAYSKVTDPLVVYQKYVIWMKNLESGFQYMT